MTVLPCSWLKIEWKLTLYRPMCFEPPKRVSFSDPAYTASSSQQSIVHLASS